MDISNPDCKKVVLFYRGVETYPREEWFEINIHRTRFFQAVRTRIFVIVRLGQKQRLKNSVRISNSASVSKNLEKRMLQQMNGESAMCTAKVFPNDVVPKNVSKVKVMRRPQCKPVIPGPVSLNTGQADKKKKKKKKR